LTSPANRKRPAKPPTPTSSKPASSSSSASATYKTPRPISRNPKSPSASSSSPPSLRTSTSSTTSTPDLVTPDLPLPAEEARAKAAASSPDLRAARFGVEAAGYDVSVARYGYLPSLSFDLFYGINANRFAVNGGRGDEVDRRNLGYSGQVTLNIPIWNWGLTKSRIAQAELRRNQAKFDLGLAEKTLQASLAAALAEARAAQQQLESLRSSVDLAQESLRLTVLRYTAGEAIAFEVVDAQSTVTLARNAYDDGQIRNRISQATLQLITGVL
jgi:outer membrane protein